MAAGSKKVLYAALAGNSLISVTKFAAATITGSSAMLSEGVHSLVDTGNQVLLLWGLRKAQKPPDPEFPYGHGKEVYFWSFVVAILIFAVGAGVSLYEGIHHVREPAPIERPMVNYVVLGLAVLFEGFAFGVAWKEFQKVRGRRGMIEAVSRSKDPTTFVVLFEDAAAMLGLLVALAGIALSQVTGVLWLDGAASVVIGLILGATALWLAYETKGLLIGEGASRPVVNEIRRLASEHDGVERLNQILTMHMGPSFILVNMSVKFEDKLSAKEAAQVIDSLEAKIKEAVPDAKKIFVEAEDGWGHD